MGESNYECPRIVMYVDEEEYEVGEITRVEINNYIGEILDYIESNLGRKVPYYTFFDLDTHIEMYGCIVFPVTTFLDDLSEDEIKLLVSLGIDLFDESEED